MVRRPAQTATKRKRRHTTDMEDLTEGEDDLPAAISLISRSADGAPAKWVTFGSGGLFPVCVLRCFLRMTMTRRPSSTTAPASQLTKGPSLVRDGRDQSQLFIRHTKIPK